MATVALLMGFAVAFAQAPVAPERVPVPAIIGQSTFPLVTPHQEFRARVAMALETAVIRGVINRAGAAEAISSFYRSPSYDAGIQRTFGQGSGGRGESPHSGGLAADVRTDAINEGRYADWLEILHEQGLAVPFPWDPVHLEPEAGTALFDARAGTSNPYPRDSYRDQVAKLAELREAIDAGEVPAVASLGALLPTGRVGSERVAREVIGAFHESAARALVGNSGAARELTDWYRQRAGGRSAVPSADGALPFWARGDAARAASAPGFLDLGTATDVPGGVPAALQPNEAYSMTRVRALTEERLQLQERVRELRQQELEAERERERRYAQTRAAQLERERLARVREDEAARERGRRDREAEAHRERTERARLERERAEDERRRADADRRRRDLEDLQRVRPERPRSDPRPDASAPRPAMSCGAMRCWHVEISPSEAAPEPQVVPLDTLDVP